MWLITKDYIYSGIENFPTKHKIGYCISRYESGLIHSLFFFKPSKQISTAQSPHFLIVSLPTRSSFVILEPDASALV